VCCENGELSKSRRRWRKNRAERVRAKAGAQKTFLGRHGLKIKAIGEAARRELSELPDRKVHLFLHVLVGHEKK
jgi:GTPase Era involved in 16S rRNA processing